MCKRLYPISKSHFVRSIDPLIKKSYSRAGTPSKISNYQVFCAMLYVLRTGIPWRDLPKFYGNWNHVYQGFKRSSDRGTWWKVLYKLQQSKQLKMNIVISDSSTIKFYRHGGGFKGGSSQEVGASVV